MARRTAHISSLSSPSAGYVWTGIHTDIHIVQKKGSCSLLEVAEAEGGETKTARSISRLQSTVLGFLLVTHLVSLYLLAGLVTSYVPWPTLTYKAGMGNRQQEGEPHGANINITHVSQPQPTASCFGEF